MKKISTILFFLVSVMAQSIYAQGFVLQSPDIKGQLSKEQVFNGFGCHGDNVSPQLNWQNAPKGSKSFAVTLYDPDAPTGSGWWHWLVFDIPAQVHSLKKNAGNIEAQSAPKGSIQSHSSFARSGFGGACPPKGDKPHRYIFTVYALKIATLGLDEKATPALVGFYLNANALAKASLIAYYGR